MPEEFPTEAVLESSRDLDRRSVAEILEVIHREDRRALDAIGAVLPQIAQGAELLLATLRAGGRWINVGAGTSGRMGTLDAAELPPTFGVAPHRVQAVMAGGPAALFQAVEGAEDSSDAARRALIERELGAHDAVLAISASGRTPFARAALAFARELGARRLALTCDPDSPLARDAEVSIAPRVGPEVIAGSTRMKGGLVQKCALHLLSTTVMVKLGHVDGNLMTSLRPVSNKLRRRAVRIVMALGDVDEAQACELLELSGGDVRAALAGARVRGAPRVSVVPRSRAGQ
ncbi:MAG: N-acetylmuramic acid 6-phosphate etherase [Deltaproteobacteria bacterium]|nr:MAG: N-acetylmuramic acid 6-phosphate etherase [Deltaproteobacteria bacterium]